MKNIDPIINARILLVEGSRKDQLLLMERLNDLGIHNITVSSSGEQAIDMLEEDTAFDLIIIEYFLPGVSGIEIIKEVKIKFNEIPIIMITGLGSEQIAVEAMKLGIHDYLTKADIQKEVFKSSITQTLVINQVKKEMELKKRLEEDPHQISVSFFKFGNMGPEPVITTILPFEKLFSAEQDRETFLIRIGTHYMSATATGHDYAEGLFELPVPNKNEGVEEEDIQYFNRYHSLVYGFRMADKRHQDTRIRSSGSLNYGLVVVIFPILFRSILPNRSVIERKLNDLLGDYTDMGDLNLVFLMKAKEIFISSK
ncbi:MAG: response regulator [Candidatus Kariarchaeaceae archaeon]|jgi:CheY-like chemotaxis protein